MSARAGAALLLVLGLATRAAATDPCARGAVRPGPGSLNPFRAPAPKAVELNAAGKIPYRLGKWDEAREQYRAAEAADPELLAAKLNIACSFVRQDRFAEATTEVVALLDRAYVPWGREILEATDLGALKVRPEMKTVRAAMAAAAARWGEGLDASALFVARKRPPLRVPDGPGVFLLNPQQEVWAFTPSTQRYRQLTAEDGHVVALAHVGGRAVYVTAEKLVRGARPGDVALRGVAIHVLTLASMAPDPAARVDGDVTRLVIGQAGDLVFSIVVGGRHTLRRLDGKGGLAETPTPRAWNDLVVLTAHGVEPVQERRLGGRCPLVARQARAKAGPSGPLSVGPPQGPFSPIATGQGAGLGGLPIP